MKKDIGKKRGSKMPQSISEREFFRQVKEARDKTVTELLREKPLTRPEIVKMTGIPRTHVIDSIRRIGAEVVKKIYSGHRGRPQVVFGFKK